MSNKEHSKRESHDVNKQDRQHADKNNRDAGRTHAAQANGGADDYRSTDLHDSPMMAYLLDALEKGRDIGHFGRLTFVMVARFFLSDDEIVRLLEKQPGVEEKEVRAQLLQVKQRDYNPPKRERILQWMEQQDFPICPNPDDPNACNVYRELQFPDGIYDNINEFWEEKAEEQDEA